jgi:hypothetical protein
LRAAFWTECPKATVPNATAIREGRASTRVWEKLQVLSGEV